MATKKAKGTVAPKGDSDIAIDADELEKLVQTSEKAEGSGGEELIGDEPASEELIGAESASEELIGAEPEAAPPDVEPAEFATFPPASTQPKGADNIDLLMDVDLNVTVELGRVDMTVKDVLNLGSGSIIELEKLAGEPVDILVNGLTVAHGEVVVIDEKFGVRVTKVVDSRDVA